MSLTHLYVHTWRRAALVLPRRRDRVWYLLRVNPVFIMAWWLVWLIPLWIGFGMYLRDEGQIWERTEKSDANHTLVRALRAQPAIRASTVGSAQRSKTARPEPVQLRI